MKDQSKLRIALSRVPNKSALARATGLPMRTMWRFLSGGDIRAGSLALVRDALRNNGTRKHE